MIFPLSYRGLIRGAKEHLAQGLLAAADYQAHFEPVYAPVDGTVYHFDDEGGGTWLGIRANDGTHFEFAHLSQRIAKQGSTCRVGDEIAITGDSGDLTATGIGKVLPHLHHQLIKNGQRIDPEEFYFAYNIPVIGINGTIDFMTSVQKKILDYSQGMCTISWDLPNFVMPSDPNEFEAYEIIDRFLAANPKQYLPNRFFILFDKGTNALARTYYYPKKDCCISVIPSNGLDPKTVVYELVNAFVFYYNEHRDGLPYIEPVDSNFPDDNFILNKYRSVLPYIEILNR